MQIHCLRLHNAHFEEARLGMLQAATVQLSGMQLRPAGLLAGKVLSAREAKATPTECNAATGKSVGW